MPPDRPRTLTFRPSVPLASVVLKEQPATAIYRNGENSIVIRQQAAWDRDEDSFVYTTEQNVMAFVDQLCDAVGIAEFGGPKAGRS